jgi:hypothetical protein
MGEGTTGEALLISCEAKQSEAPIKKSFRISLKFIGFNGWWAKPTLGL